MVSWRQTLPCCLTLTTAQLTQFESHLGILTLTQMVAEMWISFFFKLILGSNSIFYDVLILSSRKEDSLIDIQKKAH